MDPFELRKKLVQPQIRSRVKKLQTGEPVSPVVVELDPTSYCDLACPNCVTGDVLNNGRFDARRLDAFADEFVDMNVLGVILIGGGEPLIHPGTAKLAERLHQLGVKVGLVTNGTLIKRDAPSLARSCDWIRVSVDAATPSTYSDIRPSRSRKDTFSTVLSGISAIANQRPRNARVGYSVVVRGSNENSRVSNIREISAAAVLAQSLQCDYVEYKAEMDNDHRIVPISQAEKTLIESEIQLARLSENMDFRVHLSSSLKALLAGEPPEGQLKPYTSCPISQLRTTVSPSGCFVCSYHRGNDRHRYGDATASPFSTIWQQRLPLVDPSTDCKFHCARHELNLELLATAVESRSDDLEESLGEGDIFL